MSSRSERHKPTGTITADMISEIKMEPVNDDNSISLDSDEEPQRHT